MIGPSFGDILSGNCFKNGVRAVVLPAEVAAGLRRQLHTRPEAGGHHRGGPGEPDRDRADGRVYRFEVDPFRKQALLRGRDEVALTLEYAREIEAFEARQAVEMP